MILNSNEAIKMHQMSLEETYQNGREYWTEESGCVILDKFERWCSKLTVEELKYTFHRLYEKGNMILCSLVQEYIESKKLRFLGTDELSKIREEFNN